jgi:hypothetical protein
MITPYSITELAGAVAVVGAAFAGLLMALFKSRCTEISCLWGACKCSRVPPPDPPQDIEQANPQTQPPPLLQQADVASGGS